MSKPFQWNSSDWRQFTRTFVTGLIAVAPVLVTVMVVLWVISAIDTVLGGFVRVLIPADRYLTGMGLAFSLVFIFFIGVAMRAIFFREFVKWIEEQLERIPLIKTVYGAVRDLMGFMSKKKTSRFGQVVMVQLPNMPMRLMGFITIEDLAKIGLANEGDEAVAVYLPMSYQIGGYTIFVPRSLLTPVDMTFEDAMRFLITAGLSRSDDPAHLSAGIIVPPEAGKPKS